MLKMLKKEDLQIGMRVFRSQLDMICGVWIYFDSYTEDNGGKIIYFTEDDKDEYVKELFKQNSKVVIFYLSPEYADDEVEHYE